MQCRIIQIWSNEHSPPQREKLTCQFHGRRYMTPGPETKTLSLMAQPANKFHVPISSSSLPSSRHMGVTQRWVWVDPAHAVDLHHVWRTPSLGNSNLLSKAANNLPNLCPRWKHHVYYTGHQIILASATSCFPRLFTLHSWKGSPEQKTVSISAQKTFINIKD